MARIVSRKAPAASTPADTSAVLALKADVPAAPDGADEDGAFVPAVNAIDAAAAAANLVYLKIPAADLRKAGAKPANGLIMVKPETVAITEGYNIREHGFDPDTNADDRKLYLSMKASGFKSSDPIVVRWNEVTKKFHIVRGHRRLGAVRKLAAEGIAFAEIPALLEADGADDVSRLYDLEAGNSGVALAPIEKAFLAARLVYMKESVSDIAARWGVTPRAVRQSLETAKQVATSEALRELIQAKTINATIATELAAYHGADTAAKIIRHAAENGSKGAGKKAGKANPADIAASELIVTGFVSPVGRNHAPGAVAPAPLPAPKNDNREDDTSEDDTSEDDTSEDDTSEDDTSEDDTADKGADKGGNDKGADKGADKGGNDNTGMIRTAAEVRGGFRLGKGEFSNSIYSCEGREIGSFHNKAVASRAMALMNKGWFAEQDAAETSKEAMRTAKDNAATQAPPTPPMDVPAAPEAPAKGKARTLRTAPVQNAPARHAPSPDSKGKPFSMLGGNVNA